MKFPMALLAALLVVAGCSSDPQKAKERRDALIQQVFPNPADQQGLDLVFPLESGGVYSTIEVAYFTEVVSETEVRRRVAGFCTRQNSPILTGQVSVTKDLGLSTRSFADGSKKQVRTIFYNCVKRA